MHVSFGTWDGTEWSGTKRNAPHLVRLKRVEHVVSRDEFWVNFRSASPPGTTRSTSVEHKIITSPSPSFSSCFYPRASLLPLCSIPSCFISSHSVPSCLKEKEIVVVKFMAMGSERTKALHNFNLLFDLKWGNQKHLWGERVSD
ncbi:hypothetical protein DVH24_031473 [Malus domestica]|uniref:Uncharacterized protein n=1 Tax=Malus domestica TaxID=3750 RepID=A0A498HED2_MALDO|nr:hypothetical protein DVH24_031473 [Malus domestica]